MAEIKPYVSKRRRQNDESTSPVEAKRHFSNAGNWMLPTVSQINEKRDASSLHIDSEIPSKKGAKSKYFLPRSYVEALKFHENAVNHIRWNNSSNANLLATASMDGAVSLLRSFRGGCSLVGNIKSHGSAVKDVRWNCDDRNLLSGGYDKYARITDSETGKELFSFKHKDYVTSVLYHPELEHVFLSGTGSSGIYAVDSRAGKEIHHYKTFFGQIQDLIFHPNGQTFFSAAEILKRNSMDKAIIAWDFQTTAIVSNQISQEAFGCSCLHNHPFDPVFLAQYGTGYISMFSNASPYKLNKYKRFEGHQTAGYNISFSISRDGSCVASGDRDGKLFIYDYNSSNLLRKLPVFSSACMDVAFHPTWSNVIACCSWDGEVAIVQ